MISTEGFQKAVSATSQKVVKPKSEPQNSFNAEAADSLLFGRRSSSALIVHVSAVTVTLARLL